MREALLVGGEQLVLTGLGVDLLDLLQAEPQQVGLLRALARPRGQLLQALGDVAVPAVGGDVAAQRLGHLVAREPVERGALPPGLEQALLVGLAVHGDEVVGDVDEHRDRDLTAAEMGARSSLRGDRTA